MAREVNIPGTRAYTAFGKHWGPGVVDIDTGSDEEDDKIADTLEAAVTRIEGAAQQAQQAQETRQEARVRELKAGNTKAGLIEYVEQEGIEIEDPEAMTKDQLARAIAEYESQDEE